MSRHKKHKIINQQSPYFLNPSFVFLVLFYGSPLCTRDNAVDIAKQQILATRTFDNVAQRITVLLRVADLLWPHEQDKAMAAFMEAFDLAVQNSKEDQRFKVISAIAKRDPATALKLSNRMLQETAKEPDDDQSKRKISEKIVALANGLIATDVATAVNFARSSFKYPAMLTLPVFLYDLARKDRAAADQFYVEALAAYGAAPMDQFLYLSSYPFGNTSEAGEMPNITLYRVPEDFVPNRALQRRFLQALLNRIESAMELPVATVPGSRYSDQAQMWLALNRLEKQLQSELPDLFDSAMQSKDKLFTLLNPTTQRSVNGVINSENGPKKTFEDLIEFLEKTRKTVDQRDRDLTGAIITASSALPIERLVSAIDKISDGNTRTSLLNAVYHFRTQTLIAEKKLTEARKLASKIAELDHRAYLLARIAEASLNQRGDQTEARELLNEIADAVSKAPKTIVTARAVLAQAYLYSKIDTNRGVEELANAVKTINALESPDFSQQHVIMKIESKPFASTAVFSTPGFNPENSFREMGKLDFDGSLAQATSLNDKYLRALTTLAVIEPCLDTKRHQKTAN